MRRILVLIPIVVVLLAATAPTALAQPARWAQSLIPVASADEAPPASNNIWQGSTSPDDEDYLNPSDFQRKDLRISKEESLEKFVLKAILFVLGFLSVILLLVLIIGGYKILIARGEEESYTQGKKILTNALIGFVVIILSYAIINELLWSTSILRTIFAIFG